MKRTTVLLLSFILYMCGAPVTVQADDICKPLYSMSEKQWQVLYQAYDTGAADDLGHTMMALAFGESTAGKYKVNLESHDFGVMQNNLKTVKARTGTKGYYPTRAMITRLVTDDQFSMDYALIELLYWKKHTKGWANMVSAYNNGWSYHKGSVFLNKVRKNTRMMMSCVDMDMFTKNDGVQTEDDVGDLVASFADNKHTRHTLTLEPMTTGPYTGTSHDGVARASEKASTWSQVKNRLSRMWS